MKLRKWYKAPNEPQDDVATELKPGKEALNKPAPLIAHLSTFNSYVYAVL